MLDMIQNKPLEKLSQRGEQGYGMKITDSGKRLLWHRTYECMLEKTRKHFTLDRNIKNTRNRITKKASPNLQKQGRNLIRAGCLSRIELGQKTEHTLRRDRKFPVTVGKRKKANIIIGVEVTGKSVGKFTE